ncbi:penicillin-binding protein 2 [Idiomarina tyrosinivorans]|uniref:Peptidoglycan D,D-transpeptidase MrdA n=1 Tax=Idiomarina tyrosinivorans TaxID=1445662 RepID=A0A432ZRB3_9GAMM|nr:penicillin-binding protein 2 [Idiomarina tyrosinivorans]RUO80450.1 penicillin-binding protein 2 [Idiomarina tyrosinivorans]
MRKRQTIRDHGAEAQLFFRRTVFCAFVILVLLGVLVANLYYLQVIEYQSLQTRSNDNRIKLLPLAPNRGLIYDRNGQLLAENVPIFSLDVVPEEVSDIETTLKDLQRLLDIPEKNIQAFDDARKRERRFQQITLMDDLNEQQLAKFAAQQYRFPGVSIEARLSRYYPQGEILTHGLGYVAKINRRDVQRLEKENRIANYAATRTIGKLGIEKYYEQRLHGEVGYQRVEVNNRGRVVRTLDVEAPKPGEDLHLTLDMRLQEKAYHLLDDQRGSIVLLDTRTGGVLAMVSRPSYDPNWFVNGISYERYQGLLNSKHSPLLNRATQGGYPPASTIKPMLGVIALDRDIITPTSRIWDPGWFEIKGAKRRYRDWLSWGHGWVNISTAITESCDTFYYDLSLKMGIDLISSSMEEFGFGNFTGIDISEEIDAVMPSRGWKRARFNAPWYAGETISVGIGQSYWTATPLQLAVATSIIANRGKHLEPHFLAYSVIDGETQKYQPVERPPVSINEPKSWEIVRNAMRAVTHSIHGTAYSSFGDAPYDSAGKTGTAQVRSLGANEEYNADEIAERFRDNAMYIGFAPVKEPEIAIAVAVENAGGGGSVAAPMARELMDLYFTLYHPASTEADDADD